MMTKSSLLTPAEAIEALRQQAKVNAEALVQLDAELRPFFAEELELVRAIARTYPYRIDTDKFGGPVPVVTGWSQATEERLELRERLDAIQIETAGLRLDHKELKRLRGWYAYRIMELEAELRNPPPKAKKPPQFPNKRASGTFRHGQLKLL
jgi:hypothetical protein